MTEAQHLEALETHAAELRADPLEPHLSTRQVAAKLGLEIARIRLWLETHRVPGLQPPIYRPQTRLPWRMERVFRPSDVRAIGLYALSTARSSWRKPITPAPWMGQGSQSARPRMRAREPRPPRHATA